MLSKSKVLSLSFQHYGPTTSLNAKCLEHGATFMITLKERVSPKQISYDQLQKIQIFASLMENTSEIVVFQAQSAQSA